MPRPENPLDPASSPVARFAHELRELRNRAGRPSYREMQTRVGVSYSSLSRAASGRRLPSWPIVHGFVMACNGDPDEWRARWRAVRDVHDLLPDPAGIETVAQLRSAVRDIFRRHDLGVVSAAMRTPLATVRQLSRWPEGVEEGLFERFLRACGTSEQETLEWTAMWRKVVAPGAVPTAVPERLGPPADPATLPNYAALLAALRSLHAASGVCIDDIERITGGRLRSGGAAAILAGERPATGEELVLLLRALGVREGVDRWIDSWFRVSWARLERDPSSGLVPMPIRRMVDTVVVLLVSLWVVLAAALL